MRILKGEECNFSIENGAYDGGIPMGLNKLLIVNCQANIAEYERWPRVLNGSPFLKENGYQDDLLDDLYKQL